jgi:hypothetical protein
MLLLFAEIASSLRASTTRLDVIASGAKQSRAVFYSAARTCAAAPDLWPFWWK